jgi:EF-hand domain pair/EF hand
MFLQTRRSRLIAYATLLAGLMGAAAFAAESTPPTPAPDAAPPAGKPGALDVNKMNERAAQIFTKADANGDGKITETEFLAAEPARGAGRHRMGPGMHGGMGAGPGMGPGPGMGDGMGHPGPHGGMTAEQQQAFMADLFKALDSDGNGQLAPAEFAKLHTTMQTMMRKTAFTRLDTNGDGVLTKDEYPRFAAKLAAADADGDGTVTRAEMQAAKQPAPSKTPN